MAVTEVTKVRTRVVVTGRVQGVWFRAATAQRARELSLAGWVRNLDNGAVEAVFEGDMDAVEAAVDFVRTGPPAASVDGVQIFRQGADPEHDESDEVGARFEVR